MQVTPTGKRMLLKGIKKPEPQPGEIIKPETYREPTQLHHVVHPGMSTTIKAGEIVVTRAHAGDEIDINGEPHLIIDEELILAVIK